MNKNDPSRMGDGSEVLLTRLPDVDIKIHASGICLVTAVVPTTCVVVVVVVIMCLVAALQDESRYNGEEDEADDVFDRMFLFHNHAFGI
jgi:hypothetical protein